jgi:dolichol-phosphate mannosyltransferase
MTWYLIPIYNERPNLELLVNNLLPLLEQEDRILFSDDGSTDGTALFFQENQHDQILTLRNPINQGPGIAFELGLKYILKHQYTYLPTEVEKSQHDNTIIITMEGDNTSRLSEIVAMKTKIAEGADLVLASVYLPDGGLENTNWYRLLLSQLANRYARWMMGIHEKTITSFFRAYRLTLLEKIQAEFQVFCKEKGFICKVELLMKAKHCGAKIEEIPTLLQSSKRKGNSKMKLFKTAMEYFWFVTKKF